MAELREPRTPLRPRHRRPRPTAGSTRRSASPGLSTRRRTGSAGRRRSSGPGPGILGSATHYGHGGMAALDNAHAALALGLPTLLSPRLSDGRPATAPPRRQPPHRARCWSCCWAGSRCRSRPAPRPARRLRRARRRAPPVRGYDRRPRRLRVQRAADPDHGPRARRRTRCSSPRALAAGRALAEAAGAGR